MAIKKRVKIGLDVDGVLRDFDTKALEIIKRLYPDKVKSDITTSWDYIDNVSVDIKDLSKIWTETHCDEIFREANMIPEIKSELKILKEWIRSYRKVPFKLVIASSQIPYNINHTLYWLGANNFNFTELYFTNQKHNLDIEYLIDDSPKNYTKWIENGRDETKFILMDRPYNQNINPTNRIKSLSEAIQILEQE